MGIALTLVQMVSASVAIPKPPEDSAPPRHLRVLAFGVLIVTSLLELALVVMAYEGARRWEYVGIAVAVDLGESFAGILIFDHLIVPAILCGLSAVRGWFDRRSRRK
jgi:hypothetical protein